MSINQEGTLKEIQYGDRIYYDSVIGIAGTQWPIGTAAHPCSSLANIRTICVREHISTIVVHGVLTLDAAMDDYDFVGSQPNLNAWPYDSVDLNSKSIDNASFDNLSVAGTQNGGAATFRHCYIDITAMNGWATDCIISRMISPAADCYIMHCTPADIFTLDMTGSTAIMVICDFVGEIYIEALNAAGEVDFYASGSSKVTLAASCTAGVINLYGEMVLLDLGATSTVSKYILTAANGAVADVGATVVDFDTSLTEATNDHYNGMLLMFQNGPNAGQAHVIDDYVGGTKNVSFATGDQWTDIPGNGNAFVILPNNAKLLSYSLNTILAEIAGASGIATWLGRNLPANNVSLSEVIQYIAELKPHFSTPVSATHTTASADPTEDTAFTATPIGPGLFHLTVDIADLEAGDDITFRIYQRVDGATYRLMSEQQFVGAQTLKVYQVNGIYADATALIQFRTLRTSAANRDFPYRYSIFDQPVV